LETAVRNALHIAYLSIKEVKPYAGHARVHNNKQRRKLVSLLQKFGQVTPIIVDADNVIVDGHAVHAGLQELGFDEVAVVVAQSHDPAEIRALRLALNRLPQESGWDDGALRVEFRELLELGFEMELTGFDAVEIDTALAIDEPGVGAVEAEAAENLAPSATPSARLGDIYLLGRHAIACGDARDANLVNRLANGRKVSVVFTDPPYNVKIDGFVSGLGNTRHGEFAMASGEMSKEAFRDFLAAFLAALTPALHDGAILFICMDWRHMGELLGAGERNDLELKNLCIWTKSNAGMGTFYRSAHELIFVYKHGRGPHQNNFELGQHGRSRTNVWPYRGVNAFGKNRMELLESHPTVKPTLMIADALKDVSRPGDLVFDPFLGSGSTLLAAEETGRTCVGIEFDPGYVEVAIRRWEKRTRRDAVNADTGQTFSSLLEQTAIAPPVANNGAAPLDAEAIP
jgi:DNA modification methylase